MSECHSVKEEGRLKGLCSEFEEQHAARRTASPRFAIDRPVLFIELTMLQSFIAMIASSGPIARLGGGKSLELFAVLRAGCRKAAAEFQAR